MNKQVTEDDITNIDRQSADDSMDESHKMTSQMPQIMSHCCAKTPGHSQKLFTASETVNLTDIMLKTHIKGTTGDTMMQKFTSLGSLLGVPVKLSNGIAGQTTIVVVSFFRFSDLIASHFADILWPMIVI